MSDSTSRQWVSALLFVLLVHAVNVRAEEGAADAGDAEELAPITVQGQRVAILEPANTYSALATALRYDPFVRLQPRGLPEGQADVTVRGGLFENTGFRIGSVTIIDPQTGHYAIEFPFDPAMLGSPAVLTDARHALLGFNASVATLQYPIQAPRDGGSLTAGAGSDDLRYGVVRAARVGELDDGRSIGIGASASASAGDGTVRFGDHEFERYAAQLSLAGEGSETHLLAGYHDKFFGWPGAYTGFVSLPETDHTRLTMLLADHRQDHEQGWWQVTAAWRRLEDDYDFDRRTEESGRPGSFDHETRAAMVGLTAEQRGAGLDWLLAAQFTADRLVRSTDLVGGDFSSRSYFAFSLAAQFERDLAAGRTLRLTPGLRADWSNRDEDALSPLASLQLEQRNGDRVSRVGLSYAGTSQVPGYTALKSPPQGLFGGNPELEREYADTVTLDVAWEQGPWSLRAAVFHRRDRDLVDWTFRQGAPFVRQANPVDIDVLGFESALEWSSGEAWVLASYAWLDKDADYGPAEVDASYYALNYAEHRATLAVAWRPLAAVEYRIDNEYRLAEQNPLRSTGRSSWLAAASVAWRPVFAPTAEIVLAGDNLADEDFQEFPGTPASGRQWSVSLRYSW